MNPTDIAKNVLDVQWTTRKASGCPEFFATYGDPGVRLDQIHSEFATAIEVYKAWIAALRRPIRILEIGNQFGATLHYWSRFAPIHSMVIGIDINQKVLRREAIDVMHKDVQLIEADSNANETRERVMAVLAMPEKEEYFDDVALDFLFIDGGHGFETVKKDYELYAPLVKRGIIGLHDIHLGQDQVQENWGVHEFWKQLCALEGCTRELIASQPRSIQSFGIGLVFRD